ncbi:hypothetical protein LC574_26910, partial [Nostoc sp. CHAB 5715]|nr:hypothetical protein [Nostoc sp. CHAB 5715]
MLINKKRTDWRESLILAFTYWGILLTAITEFLSLFKLITFGWILGTWGLICIILIYIYFRLNHQIIPTSEPRNSSQIKKDIKIKPFVNLLLCGIGFVVAIVGLIAI